MLIKKLFLVVICSSFIGVTATCAAKDTVIKEQDGGHINVHTDNKGHIVDYHGPSGKIIIREVLGPSNMSHDDLVNDMKRQYGGGGNKDCLIRASCSYGDIN